MAEARAEQDRAAGGRDNRLVGLHDGRTATASVELKKPVKGRRVWAYLRQTLDGRTVNRYIGEATARTRAAALRLAWQQAHNKSMLEHPGGDHPS